MDPAASGAGSFAAINDLDLAIYQPFPMIANAMRDPQTVTTNREKQHNDEKRVVKKRICTYFCFSCNRTTSLPIRIIMLSAY